MNKPIDTVQDFYKVLKENVDNIVEYLPMLIADNEEDKKMMLLFLDMIQSITEDVRSAESFAELSDTIDVDELLNTWDSTRETIRSEYNIRLGRERILKEFGYDEDLV